MRKSAALLAALLVAGAVRARAQDCVPGFYNAEPRDAQWHYGAGKGADADAARAGALDHLFLKVTGGEPGLPRDVLAGWEQDDHGECRGVHYVIIRIEKERARRNMAEALQRRKAGVKEPQASSTVVVNNITVAPAPSAAPREEDRDLKYVVLAIVFLGFIAGVAAFSRRSGRPAYVPGPSLDVASEPKPRPSPPPSDLKEQFQAVARQPQAEAMSEIAATGVPAYLKAHKGEGTCKSVPGSPELVFAGAQEMARRFGAQGWNVRSEKWASFAVKSDQVAMGFAYFVYASRMTGYTDVEILYAAGVGVQDAYRTQMEESQHQGLPWTVQAIAVRQGAARSEEGEG